MSALHSYFPSIWVGDFASKAEFDAASPSLASYFKVISAVDDRMLRSRQPFSFHAWCVACQATTEMRVTWHYCGTNAEGAVHPAWTETCRCNGCGLNSRMRALLDCLINKLGTAKNASIYLPEKVTPAFKIIKKIFGNVTGSEYLGQDRQPGETAFLVKTHFGVRHEDLCQLSFSDASFDVVLSQDVFEHIPDYRRAFSECSRILKIGGRLIFTVPFFYDLAKTRIRAKLKAGGEIEHLLPPEFHGNPVSQDGALCFQNFGWDLLEELNQAGFEQSTAHMYWGPWAGHLGFPFFVFSTRKIRCVSQ